MKNLIVRDMILSWDDGNGDPLVLERVVWVSPDYSVCYVYPLDEKTSFPFQREVTGIVWSMDNGKASKCTVDPYSFLNVSEDTLSEQKKVERDARYDAVIDIAKEEPAIYMSESRGVLISRVINDSGLTKPTIYKILRRFWLCGKKSNAQLAFTHRCGGPGKPRYPKPNSPKRGRPNQNGKIGINVDKQTTKNIKIAFETYYETSKDNSWEDAYDLFLADYCKESEHVEDGVDLPDLQSTYITQEQFEYHARKGIDPGKLLRKRMGGLFPLNNRPILGNSSQMSFGPGAIYMIDATVLDVYIVNRYNRLPLGRPTLYLVADVFSHLIVGFYLTLKKPSWEAMMMALYYTLRDKVELCAEYGVTIEHEDWPVNQLGEELFGDRGEAIAQVTDHVAASLPMDISNTPPYRPDLKGFIEQCFRTVNSRAIRSTPGSIEGMIRHIKRRKYPLDARLDMFQITKILIRMILLHNKYSWLEGYPLDELMLADEVNPVPQELWNYGVLNRSGYLRDIPLSTAMFNFLPRTDAYVTPNGIRVFGNRFYTCQKAVDENWFLRVKGKPQRTMEAAYDKRKPSGIYLVTGNNTFERCDLIEDDRWGGYTGFYEEEIEQVEDLQKNRRSDHKDSATQAKVHFQAHKNAVIAEGEKMTKRVCDFLGIRPTDSKRLEYMGQLKEEFVRLQDAKEAWVFDANGEISGEDMTPQKHESLWTDIENELLDDIEE